VHALKKIERTLTVTSTKYRVRPNHAKVSQAG
jgi:hypothetical protein